MKRFMADYLQSLEEGALQLHFESSASFIQKVADTSGRAYVGVGLSHAWDDAKQQGRIEQQDYERQARHRTSIDVTVQQSYADFPTCIDRGSFRDSKKISTCNTTSCLHSPKLFNMFTCPDQTTKTSIELRAPTDHDKW